MDLFSLIHAGMFQPQELQGGKEQLFFNEMILQIVIRGETFQVGLDLIYTNE